MKDFKHRKSITRLQQLEERVEQLEKRFILRSPPSDSALEKDEGIPTEENDLETGEFRLSQEQKQQGEDESVSFTPIIQSTSNISHYRHSTSDTRVKQLEMKLKQLVEQIQAMRKVLQSVRMKNAKLNKKVKELEKNAEKMKITK